ncbi:MAG: hypothetical protein V1799_16905 [bacterium]
MNSVPLLNRMKVPWRAGWIAFFLLSASVFAQESTVYLSVVSTKGFVVGAANPQTGLLFKKTTDDTLWQHSGPTNIRAFGVAVYTPMKGKILSIASGNGVHYSTDAGATWKITTGWNITEVQQVVFDQANADVQYCATPYGVFKTSNGGKIWKEMNEGIGEKFMTSIVIDHADPNRLYCATEDGVYRSENGGATWKRTSLSVGGVRVVAQHPKNPAVLIAGTEDHGMYLSTTGGRIWEKVEAGLDHKTFYSIAFDPTNPAMVYAGGYMTGIYKSRDGGKSWNRVNDGLTNLNIHSIAVDPQKGSRVYIATFYGGVFCSDNGGDLWRYVGLNGSQVWTLTVQPF